MMDEELLKILVCPQCKGEIVWREDKIICPRCKKYYPIREGIPIMLAEETKDYNKIEAGGRILDLP